MQKIALITFILLTMVYSVHIDDKIHIGMEAPDFTAIDQNGDTLHLYDRLGDYIVLYFFPKAFTPG